MVASAQLVTDALRDRYIKESTDTANASRDDVIELLRELATKKISKSSLLAIIADAKPDWVMADEDSAIIHAVDDCSRLIFKVLDVEPEIEVLLRRATPEITCQLLQHPQMPVDLPEYSVMEVMDLLVNACVGWSKDLGKAGDKLIETVTGVINHLRKGSTEYQKLEAALQAFLDKEQIRTQKLEERLIASETGLLRSNRSKIAAAQMINKAMRNKKLPGPIIEFLQGPWYGSIQILGLTKGFDSEEWFRASKLTETLIWTFQPIDEDTPELEEKTKQRLYRIVESITGEIRELLVALEHETGKTEDAIDDIENQHVNVVSGQIIDYRKFKPIVSDAGETTAAPSVSRILLRKINSLETGQWFTYEEGEINIRIKLVLKLDDIKQVLFTNRNGMKALAKSFDELAYLFSSGVVKPLNHIDIYSSTFDKYFHSLIEEFDKKRKQAVEDRQKSEEDAIVKEAARKKALTEAAALKRAREDAEKDRQAQLKEETLAKAKAASELEENQQKIPEMTAQVKSLNTGAVLVLPGADGVMEDSKLAVKIAAVDKMIFVNQAGLKMGEYSTEQLVQLLLSGDAEIKEGGVGFEDTLAQVVTKLRQDRDKSYDDLTGA